MRFIEEIYVENFNDLYYFCWSGAIDRLDEIYNNDLEEEFMEYLRENFFEDGDYTTTDLNDFIWFECDDWIEEHKRSDEDDV